MKTLLFSFILMLAFILTPTIDLKIGFFGILKTAEIKAAEPPVIGPTFTPSTSTTPQSITNTPIIPSVTTITRSATVANNPYVAPPQVTAQNANARNTSTSNAGAKSSSKVEHALQLLPEYNALSAQIAKNVQDNYAFLEEAGLSLQEMIGVTSKGENYAIIYTTEKTILIELYPSKAPKAVEHFKKMVRSGFYTDSTFFRLIPNYFIQGGDPTDTGYGGSGNLQEAELSDLKFERGSIAFSNTGNLKSDDSQFFITFNSFAWLDDKYSIFGRVVSGMDYLETIEGSFTNEGFLKTPVVINKVTIAADLLPSATNNTAGSTRFSSVTEVPSATTQAPIASSSIKATLTETSSSNKSDNKITDSATSRDTSLSNVSERPSTEITSKSKATAENSMGTTLATTEAEESSNINPVDTISDGNNFTPIITTTPNYTGYSSQPTPPRGATVPTR
ncbi:Peptidylprolyl isomerase [Candidatus Hepatincolaceae symbiont of Richtersius coronifer]